MDSGSPTATDRATAVAERNLDHSACYEAVRRRDARFDGHFYTAVTTTGIFCRPSCPARTPRSSNVRFFTHAAGASMAGFRPCRRCRPELAPGHPEWNRRTDLVGKALAQIERGVVDTDGVAGLATNLGVSERHLRRELKEVVGAGPNQLARTRRLWLARLMLDQTNLAITDVAFASGFSSVRQFNEAFRHAFDATPSSLRRRPDAAATGATELTLTLQCRGELQWPQLHRFLTARAIDGVEHSTPDGFGRAVERVTIELSSDPGQQQLVMRCSVDRLDRVAQLVPLVRQVADLDADLDSIADHLRTDPELARRLDHAPLPRIPGAFDPFELAVRAVIGQQVSVAGARTTLSKLVALAKPDSPTSADSPSGRHQRPDEQARSPLTQFPTPEQILDAPLDRLGVPSRRRETVRALAAAVADGSIDLSSAADRDETTARLLDLPGIGPWTAGYIAMRGLNDPNGWPAGDLVLRNSLGVDPTELERRSERWKPWRGYAALLLWSTSKLELPDPVRGTAMKEKR